MSAVRPNPWAAARGPAASRPASLLRHRDSLLAVPSSGVSSPRSVRESRRFRPIRILMQVKDYRPHSTERSSLIAA